MRANITDMERLKLTPLTGLLLILFISGLTFYACHREQPRRVEPSNKDVNKEKPVTPLDKEHQVQLLKNAHAAANSILNSLEGDDYDGALQQLEPLQSAAKNLPSPQLNHPDINPDLGDLFQLYVVQLERSLNNEDKASARFEATWLYGISGDFLSRLQVGEPPDLERFILLTREFSIWADSRDEEMLEIRATAIRNAWNDLRRSIIQKRNAQATAEFDGISQQLEQAGSIDDYINLVQPMHDATDHIEELFRQ